MKDCVWILIALCASFGTVKVIGNSIWSPTCPLSNSSPDNVLIPHPGDCRKFFLCIEGIAYPLSCPYGLNWNPTLKKCTIVTCQAIQYTKIPKYNPLCPLNEDPSSPTHLPNDNDCTQFYECQGGFAFDMICPLGQHWSVEHNNCEDPSVANCKTTTGAVGNGMLNAACPLNEDPEDPTHLPYPEDCTKFYKCSFGRSFMVSCPDGLHWDVKSNRCESPFVAQCVASSSSTSKKTPETTTRVTSPSSSMSTKFTPSTSKKPPETTTRVTSPSSSMSTKSTPSTSKPSSNLPICPEVGIENFGIPGQCDKFFSCSAGKLYLMTCRAGREWSEEAKACIDAALAGCTGLSGVSGIPRTTVTKIPTSTTERTTTKRPTSCSPGVAYISHPTSCQKFIICDNGKPVEMSCPGGLYWSHSTSNCQWSSTDC